MVIPTYLNHSIFPLAKRVNSCQMDRKIWKHVQKNMETWIEKYGNMDKKYGNMDRKIWKHGQKNMETLIEKYGNMDRKIWKHG